MAVSMEYKIWNWQPYFHYAKGGSGEVSFATAKEAYEDYFKFILHGWMETPMGNGFNVGDGFINGFPGIQRRERPDLAKFEFRTLFDVRIEVKGEDRVWFTYLAPKDKNIVVEIILTTI